MTPPYPAQIRITAQEPEKPPKFGWLWPGQNVMIGRGLKSGLQIMGEKVSRSHAELVYHPDGRLELVDQKSRNGTYVNGLPIERAVLEGSEEIRIGEWSFRIEPVDNDPTADFEKSGLKDRLSAASKVEPEDDESWEAPTRAAESAGAPLAAKAQEASQPAQALPTNTEQINMGEIWAWEEPGSEKEISDSIKVQSPYQSNLVQQLQEVVTNLNPDPSGDSSEVFSRPLAGAHKKVRSTEEESLSWQLLFRVSQALLVARTTHSFLNEIAGTLLEALMASSVAIIMPDDNGTMVPYALKHFTQSQSIRFSRNLLDKCIQDAATVSYEEDASGAVNLAEPHTSTHLLPSAMAAPLLRGSEVLGAIYITRGSAFSDEERDLASGFGFLTAAGLERVRLEQEMAAKDRRRGALERFQSPEVIRWIMSRTAALPSDQLSPLELEATEATVLFCDLSGFTEFCERNPPETVGQLLNRYLERMTNIVFAHGGIVDKYIGDAVMCLFGAPYEADDDAERAARCATDMVTGFQALVRDEPELASARDLTVHIGINTGRLMAGTVGSQLRVDYTVLGDVVNTAARLQGMAEPGQILAGKKTMDGCSDAVLRNSMGLLSLRGKIEPLEVFEVLLPGIPIEEQSDRKRLKARSYSVIDEDTRCFSTSYLIDCMLREMGRALRYSRPLGLLVVDVTGYSTIEKASGPRDAVAALALFAGEVRRRIRVEDVFARLDARRLAILIPEGDEAAAKTLSEKVVQIGRDIWQERAIPLDIGVGTAFLDEVMAKSLADDEKTEGFRVDRGPDIPLNTLKLAQLSTAQREDLAQGFIALAQSRVTT
jgi:adenylate cyclase